MNKTAIFFAVIASIVVIATFIISGWHNTAIRQEENINTSLSNISKEEQRRVDLFNNLVDAVESYNKFEKQTITQVIEARALGSQGKIEEAMLVLSSIVEAYPDLKSIQNYDKTLLEFSITENRIASYREQYNNDVRAYNKYIRSFPINWVLDKIGYMKVDYQYLEYNVDNNDARNLFEADPNT